MSATYPESLFDAVAALRSGSISANELALQTLERARRAQQRTNCFLAIEAETLLRGAERADLVLADARRRGVMPVGALQGVPLAHKDMFGRGGGVVRYGSKVALDQAPRQIATATARLEQAGALEAGPLNMAEFALGATGHNAAYGYRYGGRPDWEGVADHDAVYRRFLKYLPGAADIPVAHRWTGAVGLTWNRICSMGVRGEARNVYYGVGYSGHGVTLANLAGRVIADLFDHQEAEWAGQPFFKGEMAWMPPEPFRWIGYHTVTRLTGKSPRKRGVKV